jgi:hypothetical protein
MDALANASFASPLANANLKIPPGSSNTGLLTGLYNGFNVWTALVTVFLTLVAYDQCEPPVRKVAMGDGVLTGRLRHVHMAEGLHRRSVMEDAVHRALPRVGLSRLQQVQGEMGKWRVELCFRLSQVRTLGVL